MFCANVTFEPGALSAWHMHPMGQIVTAGCGWSRCEDGPIQEIRAGDTIRPIDLIPSAELIAFFKETLK